jgi:ABC-2 type transport system permease protein
MVACVQAVSIGALGLGLGWSPSWTGLPAALVVGVLGTAAFAALGLLLGGTMRAEGVLAVANLIWVLLAAAGGLLLPHRGAVADAVALLPSGALGDGLRSALLDGAPAWREMAVLAVWALIAAAATRRWFRWS